MVPLAMNLVLAAAVAADVVVEVVVVVDVDIVVTVFLAQCRRLVAFFRACRKYCWHPRQQIVCCCCRFTFLKLIGTFRLPITAT